MKINKIFLIFTLFLVNFTSFLEPKVSVNKIKDLVNVLNPEYEYLSPIHGAMLWESDYVKNFYQFAPDSDTKKLVKEMFYLQPDGVTFAITTNPLKIAHYFSPQIIGKIIGLTVDVLSKAQKAPNYSLLQKKIRTLVEPLVFEYKENKKEKKNKQKLVKQSALTKIYSFYDRIENRFAEQIKEIKQKGVTEKELTAIEKIQNSIKANQKVKNNPEPLMTENINLFTKHFVAAIKEEKTTDTLFPQNHSIFILLSALWDISDNKQDFLNYFLSLQNQLSKITNLFKEDYNLLKQDNQNKFLEAEYLASDYVTFYNQPNIEEYEKSCLFFLGFDTYKADLPPNIDYKGSVIYKDISFPDCGETSLLNFFNAIIYDPETKKFDVSILEKLGASQNLIDFYNSHSTVEKMANTTELHNKWANVVCGLPNVKYSNSKICDITPGLENKGIDNIFAVLQELLPGIKKEESLNILEQIAKTLESTGMKITISMPNKKDKPQQKIGLTYSKGNRGFLLTWIFQSGHFILEFPNNIYGTGFKYTIQNKISEEKLSGYNLIKYFIIARPLGAIFETEFLNDKKQLVLYYLLIQKLDSNSILNTMKITEDFNINANYKKQLILNLYSTLPQNDYYIQEQATGILVKKLPFEEYEDKLSQVGKGQLASQIINQKQTENFKILEKLLPKLKLYSKGNIIKTILQKGSIEEDQSIFHDLYKKIELMLNKSKNEKFLSIYIKHILSLFSGDYWARQKKYDSNFNINENINFENIAQFIYPSIKKAISKITTPKCTLHVFDGIIAIDPKLIDINFLRYLQNWARKVLSSLNTYDEKFRAFEDIADAPIENTDKAFFKFLYVWSANFIKTMNVQEKPASKIDYLLIMATHKNKLVTDTIYNWLKKNLKLITNEKDQIKALKVIFDYFSSEEIKNINPQILDFIKKWVDKVLPKLKNKKLNKKFKKWQTKIKEAQGAKKEELQEHAESEESIESSESSSSGSSSSSSSSYYLSSTSESEPSFSSEEEEPLEEAPLPPPFDMEKYLKDGITEAETPKQLNNFIENNKSDVEKYKLQKLIDIKKKELTEKHQ